MANIGTWNTNFPSESSAVSGATDLHSFMTQVRTGIEESFYWRDGSSVSSLGDVKLGTARAANWAAYPSTGTLEDGWLHTAHYGVQGVTEYGISLWHNGSTQTMMLGSRFMAHARPMSPRPAFGNPPSIQTAYMLDPQGHANARWAMQSGRTSGGGLWGSTSSYSMVITFPQAYETPPVFVGVWFQNEKLSGLGADTKYCSVLSGSVSATGFTSIISDAAHVAGVNSGTVCWMSIGTLPTGTV